MRNVLAFCARSTRSYLIDTLVVIPAKAGIQVVNFSRRMVKSLDPRLRPDQSRKGSPDINFIIGTGRGGDGLVGICETGSTPLSSWCRRKRIYICLFTASQALLLISVAIPSEARQEYPRFGETVIRLSSPLEERRQTAQLFDPVNEIRADVKKGDELFFTHAASSTGAKSNHEFLFQVWIATIGSHANCVYESMLRPKQNSADEGWKNGKVSLEPYVNQQVTIRFRSAVLSKRGREISSHGLALWSAVKVANFNREPDEYNVVLISLDTLRADHLGIYGYTRNTSPRIDAMAKRGVVFMETISEAPWTLPAHMSLFSSLYPTYHGMVHNHLHPAYRSEVRRDIKLMPEYFQDAGYMTAAFTGNAHVGAHLGFYRGFLHYFEYKRWSPNNPMFSDVTRFIEQNKHNKFFLFVHTYEVHAPYRHRFFVNKEDKASENRMINRYDGGIRYVDSAVESIRKELKKQRILDRTIIVITSDHGEELRQRRLYQQHGHALYDELLRVPLIFYSPKLFKARRVDNVQVQLIDILPTFAELIKLPAASSQSFQGHSLAPLLNGEAKFSRIIAFSEAPEFWPYRHSARYVGGDGRFKLIVAPDIESFKASGVHFRPLERHQKELPAVIKKVWASGGIEFYDLEKDPAELQNLAAENPQKMKELRTRLNEFVSSTRPVPMDSATESVDEDVAEELKSLGY